MVAGRDWSLLLTLLVVVLCSMLLICWVLLFVVIGCLCVLYADCGIVGENEKGRSGPGQRTGLG